MSEENNRILKDFYTQISGNIVRSKRPRIYYKIDFNTIEIFTLIDDYDEKLEDKIYTAEFKTIKKYPLYNIKFKLSPIFKFPIKSIVPSNYTIYKPA
ncbi:MAG: hypothetical protein WC693_02270 [Patescibacteria group bacterium]|jgi:hypothetical protein